MKFGDFINLLHAGDTDSVSVEDIKNILLAHHHGLGDIDIHAIYYNEPTGGAMFRRTGEDRTSAYEDVFTHVEVTYCASLDGHSRQRRYAITKELMHSFDPPEAWAKDMGALNRLVVDIVNEPLPQDRTPEYVSEIDTRWKALVALCPLRRRNDLVSTLQNEKSHPADISEAFGIPLWTVPYVVGEYFLKARQDLIGESKIA